MPYFQDMGVVTLEQFKIVAPCQLVRQVSHIPCHWFARNHNSVGQNFKCY